MPKLSRFAAWYQERLGRLSLLIQGVLWLFYGFAWIPLWYLATGAKGPFSAWYKARLGDQLPIAQIAMWLLGGYIWIPAWYLVTRTTPIAVAVSGSSRDGDTDPHERSDPTLARDVESRPSPVFPVVTTGQRVRALLAVRPVAVEITEHGEAVEGATAVVRILQWNYTRLFALVWAALSVRIGLRNAPDPSDTDLHFILVGLLYVVFVALQIAGGSYWQSFMIVTEHSRLPLNRAGLLVASAVGGLLHLGLAAAVVGGAMFVGTSLRQ